MFRTIGDGPSAWESALPAEVLRLPEDLARVDALLDDPVFFAPFAPHFHPVLGGPSTPVEWYLRLMFLKFRHRLGYESLCAEVSDSISWRRFCRIGLDGRVPHPTTLMKLTRRCGEGAVAGLNEALWAKAAGDKLLRTTRVRADTTVICANVVYPTDSGLLARAVGKLVRSARRVQAAGGATGTTMTDRRRAAARRVREIASKLHSRGKLSREETTQAIGRITGELAGLAEKAAAQAAAVVRNGRRAVKKAISGQVRGRLVRALNELAVTIGRTAQVVAQTRSRLARSPRACRSPRYKHRAVSAGTARAPTPLREKRPRSASTSGPLVAAPRCSSGTSSETRSIPARWRRPTSTGATTSTASASCARQARASRSMPPSLGSGSELTPSPGQPDLRRPATPSDNRCGPAQVMSAAPVRSRVRWRRSPGRL